jgi:hypothetical protein
MEKQAERIVNDWLRDSIGAGYPAKLKAKTKFVEAVGSGSK